MAGEKTEKATSKRRSDERKKGNVPMYKDVTTVCSLVMSVWTLWVTGENIIVHMEEFFLFCTTLMTTSTVNIVVDNGNTIMVTMVSTLISVIAVPLIVTLLTSVIVTLYQTKGLIAKDKLKWKLDSFNIVKGFKNLFSLKSVIEALKNLVKISMLFVVIYLFFTENVLTYRLFYELHPVQSAAIIMEDLFTITMQIAMVFAVIAFADAFYQNWKWEKDMRMSKDDIKEEYKQMEGDPKVKAKIKQKQMALAQNRMMQDVPSADVIVRNPTHYAVALRYRPNIDVAPFILAMGEQELALRIIKVGERHNVPIVENVSLARALYAEGQVQHPIPHELYGAVATVIVDVLGIGKSNSEEENI